MTIFQTDEELQKVFPGATSGLSLATVAEHVELAAMDEVLPLIGLAQFQALETAYTANELTQVQAQAWALIQSATAKLAFVSYAPFATLQVSDGGAVAIETAERRSLYKYERSQAAEAAERAAYKVLNNLLLWLEMNEEAFDKWRDSPEYNVLKSSLLANASIFQQHANINQSRQLFFRLRDAIRRNEPSLLRTALGERLAEKVSAAIGAKTPAKELKALFAPLRTYLANRILAASLHTLQTDFARAGILTFAPQGEKSPDSERADPRIVQVIFDELQHTANAALAEVQRIISTRTDDYPEANTYTQAPQAGRKTYWL